jgi:hypothetical protein
VTVPFSELILKPVQLEGKYAIVVLENPHDDEYKGTIEFKVYSLVDVVSEEPPAGAPMCWETIRPVNIKPRKSKRIRVPPIEPACPTCADGDRILHAKLVDYDSQEPRYTSSGNVLPMPFGCTPAPAALHLTARPLRAPFVIDPMRDEGQRFTSHFLIPAGNPLRAGVTHTIRATLVHPDPDEPEIQAALEDEELVQLMAARGLRFAVPHGDAAAHLTISRGVPSYTWTPGASLIERGKCGCGTSIASTTACSLRRGPVPSDELDYVRPRDNDAGNPYELDLAARQLQQLILRVEHGAHSKSVKVVRIEHLRGNALVAQDCVFSIPPYDPFPLGDDDEAKEC